ncbi:PQQ-dependent sugar dehydrogenase [Chryseosolibacter histidini]|nr:PQQ-dependent sugar dehydrogenase [Chryseosolibacter histidini]
MKIPFIAIATVAICASCGPAAQNSTETRTDSATTSAVTQDQMIAPAKEIAPLPQPDTTAILFDTVTIEHPRGDTFDLYVPSGFQVAIAAHGMNRIRFMDRSADGRLFITDMLNLADNTKGKVIILEDPDSSGVFQKQSLYLDKLRNPNSLKFHKDKSGKDWLYLAMTDKLVRYPFNPGDTRPAGDAEVLDTYPDYGLSYRYGGWHLTRTIEFDDEGRLYISVGSSCNVCVEKEEVRASILVMDEDGKNRSIYAKGVRNAVGLAWTHGSLFATNMAADHLGKDQPDDAMFRVEKDRHYGWPYCYHWNGKVYADPKLDTASTKVSPHEVPGAFSYFGAHTAPLGLAWFGEHEAEDPSLKNYFLVAQHGSYSPAIGRGYSIQRVREGNPPEDFVKGFLDAKGNIHGRPCGIFSIGKDDFYFTDDKFGTLYHVYRRH